NATGAGTTLLAHTNKADGPPPHEIQRPSTHKIAVAASPGAVTYPAAATGYPLVITNNFELTVAAGGTDVARIRYDVKINKVSATDIPNTENKIVSTQKRDLVRNRDLP